MPKYRGVILDVDGTLVDSNDAHAQAWLNAFRDEGFDLELEEVRPWIGMGGDQLIPAIVGLHEDDPRYERLKEGWKQHFKNEELPHLQSFPGARSLAQELQRRGLKVVVGTSSEESLVEDLLKRADVQDVLSEYTTASDVESSKPRPDIIHAALDKLGLPPREVLMIGDTPFDIEAARKAGVDTVTLRCGGDNRFTGAVAVFNDPEDLLAHLDEVLEEPGGAEEPGAAGSTANRAAE